MARFNDIIQSFIAGEVSPKMRGRTDTDVYKRAADKIKNMVVHPQGGASRRMGTLFLADKLPLIESYNYGNLFGSIREGARLIPFIVSATESYVVILGGSLNRDDDCHITIYDPSNDRFMTIDIEDTGIDFDSVFDSAMPSYNTFTDADFLKEIQYSQQGDVMFLYHSDMPTLQIVRLGQDTFQAMHFYVRPTPSFSGVSVRLPATTSNLDLDAARSYPYTQISTAITIAASHTTGNSRTLTASASFFTSDMVGSPMALQDSGNIGYCLITGYTSATVVTVDVISTLPTTTAVSSWWEPAWSKRRGWPRAGTFWNTTRIAGDVLSSPGTLWRSQAGDIYEFTRDALLNPATTATAADPVSYTLSGAGNNNVCWIVPNKASFLVGTRGSEYAVYAFDQDNVDVRPQTENGSEYLQPVVVSAMPVHVQMGGTRIKEMLYQERENGYVDVESNFLAEHFPSYSQDLEDDTEEAQFKGLSYAKVPNDLIWAWDNNGYLYSCTRKLQGEVTAWHRHEIAGEYGTRALAFVDSVCSIPAPRGGDWDTYLLVRRTVDGATKVSFEKFQKEFTWRELHPDADKKRREPVYLDGAKIFRPHVAPTFRATFQNTTVPEVHGGVATATLSGDAAAKPYGLWFGGGGGATGYVTYDADLNADSQQVGCIRWLWHGPNGGAETCMISIAKASANSSNLIEVYEDMGAETIKLRIKNSADADIIPLSTVGSIEWGYGDPVLFELNWDLTTGATRLFVNGKQLGSTFTQTGTRDASIAQLRFGADYSGAKDARAAISHVEIFSTVQHTEDHEVYDYQASGTLVEGLDHLEGEAVRVLADGKVLNGTFTVTDGEITVDDTYSTLIVGLPYEHLLEPTKLEAGSGIGSAQGAPKRIDHLLLRFNKSAACSFGRDEDNQEEINFRDFANDNPTDPITLYTGDVRLPFEGGYDEAGSIVITGSEPLPCNITCLVARGVTYD